MLEAVERLFREAAPEADYASLRYVRGRNEQVAVRQNIVEPVSTSEDVGAMITVVDGGGLGYAGTCDLTRAGLKRAADKALEWAHRTAGKSVLDFTRVHPRSPKGEYTSRPAKPWDSVSLGDKIALLQEVCEQLKADDRIVDWDARLWHTELETLLLTSDGGRVYQRFHFLVPNMTATANEGTETQTRSFGGIGCARQGGLEVLDDLGFHEAAPRISSEALQLLAAPDCPTGKMEVLLAPDQMILQIHESIGHPLELDRILGDERNYAGTSFVTLDMFGAYRYGTELLNVTFDPTRPNQLATYAFDDDGTPAKKEYIIRNGILLRPLGGAISQARAGIPGVANSRAAGWNRPPIDRMANLNLEPGESTFDEMVRGIERGIAMETNCSWSIDDSRNKFQFGCEWGRMIEDGELKGVVRKPNYRGVSATFWRSLKQVGDAAGLQVLGTPFCGKGEPNQSIRVGHASPACVFGNVDVFGGA
ncbi:MAG: TldD/PmbA family protein [Planctomycetes bacterium]|nr:TldD/PmbA family protein [Planctomycetota bacterium]